MKTMDGAATDEDSGEGDATDFNMNNVCRKKSVCMQKQNWLLVEKGINVKMKCQR